MKTAISEIHVELKSLLLRMTGVAYKNGAGMESVYKIYEKFILAAWEAAKGEMDDFTFKAMISSFDAAQKPVNLIIDELFRLEETEA